MHPFCLSVSFPLSLSQFNFNSISISGALLAWETYVYIAKASETDNKYKSEINNKKCTLNIKHTKVSKE
jgi:hypothetical protein